MSDEFFLPPPLPASFVRRGAHPSWLHFLPLALLALAIFPLTGCGDKHENKPDPVRKVRYVVVGSAQSLPALERTGEIHAHDETTLSFRTGGRILTRSVDIGDRVTAGQLLATLDNTTGQNQLDSAAADYEGAKASAQVAALNVSRMQKLMPTGAIARTQLDSARADWLVARARLKSSEAAWRNARESLGWTRLIAPQAGVITAVSASAGQVVSDGQSVLTLATGKPATWRLILPRPMRSRLWIRRFCRFPCSATRRCRRLPHCGYHPAGRSSDPHVARQGTLQNPPEAMALGASVTVTLPSAAPHGYALPASALTRVSDKPAVL
jgi:multidrug efflux pump subunit AcrA (membrane-fusion protein)